MQGEAGHYPTTEGNAGHVPAGAFPAICGNVFRDAGCGDVPARCVRWFNPPTDASTMNKYSEIATAVE